MGGTHPGRRGQRYGRYCPYVIRFRVSALIHLFFKPLTLGTCIFFNYVLYEQRCIVLEIC